MNDTPGMPNDDKQAFAERLKLALTRSPKPVATSAELATQFNLRHAGQPVTQQAAHKWLTGKTLPTPDKMETLAAWLGVSVRWLRHGLPDDPAPLRIAGEPSPGPYPQPASEMDEASLLAGIRRLSPHQRRLILELVNQLLLERDNRAAR